ncbi:hypothetical protein [Pyramidobacter sp. CG50-2]|uniref:hypothetical protein n=1 Tax=Pyramidobacter sp. CG50-2 TaxID=2382160 RepID=UPI0011C3F30A|nr:hypothetical protein [Pyramidobacter sp. CG50-2]
MPFRGGAFMIAARTSIRLPFFRARFSFFKSGKASKTDKNPVHETAFYVNLTMMLTKNNFSGKLEKEI